MEKIIKEKLAKNQINTMFFLISLCFIITGLNCIKNKQNNKNIIELLNAISEI